MSASHGISNRSILNCEAPSPTAAGLASTAPTPADGSSAGHAPDAGARSPSGTNVRTAPANSAAISATRLNTSLRRPGNGPSTCTPKTSPRPPGRPGWKPGPIAGYTNAALPLLAQARAVLAAAVTTDRATGATWQEIAAVLDVSPDTAARHYRN
ncbi:hypothetical protein [Nonomuraea solani]|uniref:hypothetical protein n=1 Tax=Nonomuraea solani TaxID=1144553 RepID=UPI0011B0314F|nr:hypothetical protein [Nonomuraea solani]